MQYCFLIQVKENQFHFISRYIFVADWNGNTSRILRASLSGDNVTPVVDRKIVKPTGLAIDHANKHLYWADMDLNTVERIDFDGNNKSRRIIAIGMKVWRFLYFQNIIESPLQIPPESQPVICHLIVFNQPQCRVKGRQ